MRTLDSSLSINRTATRLRVRGETTFRMVVVRNIEAIPNRGYDQRWNLHISHKARCRLTRPYQGLNRAGQDKEEFMLVMACIYNHWGL